MLEQQVDEARNEVRNLKSRDASDGAPENVELENPWTEKQDQSDRADIERLGRDIKTLAERKVAKIEDKRKAFSEKEELERGLNL